MFLPTNQPWTDAICLSSLLFFFVVFIFLLFLSYNTSLYKKKEEMSSSASSFESTQKSLDHLALKESFPYRASTSSFLKETDLSFVENFQHASEITRHLAQKNSLGHTCSHILEFSPQNYEDIFFSGLQWTFSQDVSGVPYPSVSSLTSAFSPYKSYSIPASVSFEWVFPSKTFHSFLALQCESSENSFFSVLWLTQMFNSVFFSFSKIHNNWHKSINLLYAKSFDVLSQFYTSFLEERKKLEKGVYDLPFMDVDSYVYNLMNCPYVIGFSKSNPQHKEQNHLFWWDNLGSHFLETVGKMVEFIFLQESDEWTLIQEIVSSFLENLLFLKDLEVLKKCILVNVKFVKEKLTSNLPAEREKVHLFFTKLLTLKCSFFKTCQTPSSSRAVVDSLISFLEDVLIPLEDEMAKEKKSWQEEKNKVQRLFKMFMSSNHTVVEELHTYRLYRRCVKHSSTSIFWHMVLTLDVSCSYPLPQNITSMVHYWAHFMSSRVVSPPIIPGAILVKFKGDSSGPSVLQEKELAFIEKEALYNKFWVSALEEKPLDSYIVKKQKRIKLLLRMMSQCKCTNHLCSCEWKIFNTLIPSFAPLYLSLRHYLAQNSLQWKKFKKTPLFSFLVSFFNSIFFTDVPVSNFFISLEISHLKSRQFWFRGSYLLNDTCVNTFQAIGVEIIRLMCNGPLVANDTPWKETNTSFCPPALQLAVQERKSPLQSFIQSLLRLWMAKVLNLDFFDLEEEESCFLVYPQLLYPCLLWKNCQETNFTEKVIACLCLCFLLDKKLVVKEGHLSHTKLRFGYLYWHILLSFGFKSTTHMDKECRGLHQRLMKQMLFFNKILYELSSSSSSTSSTSGPHPITVAAAAAPLSSASSSSSSLETFSCRECGETRADVHSFFSFKCVSNCETQLCKPCVDRMKRQKKLSPDWNQQLLCPFCQEHLFALREWKHHPHAVLHTWIKRSTQAPSLPVAFVSLGTQEQETEHNDQKESLPTTHSTITLNNDEAEEEEERDTPQEKLSPSATLPTVELVSEKSENLPLDKKKTKNPKRRQKNKQERFFSLADAQSHLESVDVWSKLAPLLEETYGLFPLTSEIHPLLTSQVLAPSQFVPHMCKLFQEASASVRSLMTHSTLTLHCPQWTEFWEAVQAGDSSEMLASLLYKKRLYLPVFQLAWFVPDVATKTLLFLWQKVDKQKPLIVFREDLIPVCYKQPSSSSSEEKEVWHLSWFSPVEQNQDFCPSHILEHKEGLVVHTLSSPKTS